MKLMDILRKLGVLRYGVKAATYRGGRDRPIEFMADGVFKAEKDLVSGGKPPPPPKPDPAEGKKSR